MALKNSLLRRISALIVATEFLVPNISTGSRSVVVKWLKADLAALEQLRKQIQREDVNAKNGTCEPALAAIIKAKYSALDRLDKKKPRKSAASTRSRKAVSP